MLLVKDPKNQQFNVWTLKYFDRECIESAHTKIISDFFLNCEHYNKDIFVRQPCRCLM